MSVETVEPVDVDRPDRLDVCHLAHPDEAMDFDGPAVHHTLCNRTVFEAPCCAPGWPECGRPECPDCLVIAQERS